MGQVADPQPLTIDDVTITPQLAARPARVRDPETEASAIRRLADTVANGPAAVFQSCVDAALKLCLADTCGISVYERTPAGAEIFRWIALAGVLKDHLHGTTPRHFSPCGICVDSGAPVLMVRPELVYSYLAVGPPFHDVLLVPLSEKRNGVEGTIWVVSHDPDRKFDTEDARTMQRIAIFTAAALHMARVTEDACAAAAAKALAFAELDHRVKNTLQVTASLLRQRLDEVDDPAARAAINSAYGRVMTMGRAHRLANEAAVGDLASLIKNACADLAGEDFPIQVVVRAMDGVSMPANKAAALELIVNELVTNAIKHGVGDRSKVAITVGLEWVNSNEMILWVTDDGAALSLGPAKARSGGLGLGLVERLTDQLGGVFTVDREPKRFAVTFPQSGTSAGVVAGAERRLG